MAEETGRTGGFRVMKAVTPKDSFSVFMGAVVLALTIAGITGLISQSQEITALRVQVEERSRTTNEELKRIATDRQRDDKQDASLKTQWRHLSWAREAINQLQAHERMTITSPPPSSD